MTSDGKYPKLNDLNNLALPADINTLDDVSKYIDEIFSTIGFSLLDIYEVLMLKHVQFLNLSKEEIAIGKYIEDLLINQFGCVSEYFDQNNIREIEQTYFNDARFFNKRDELKSLINALRINNIVSNNQIFDIIKGLIETINTPKPGYIYVMKREDGILKFGRAIKVFQRLHDHEKDYNQKFHITRSFFTPDMMLFEHIALSITDSYSYTEGNRRELRQMSENQLSIFIQRFQELCKTAFGF